MRIHVQNPVDDPLFLFSRAMWEGAVTRAGAIGEGHEVTIGDTDADFAAGIAEAEALITEIGVVAAKFPCLAPRLKLLFITNAGLDRLAPFDWLPPSVALLNNAGVHAAKAGEFVLMSLLMLANRVPEMVTHQRAGRWQKLWGAGAGRTPRHGRGAWLAGRRGGDAGDAVRHARHRRARDGGPASALRRGRDHRRASIVCCRGRSSWCSPARSPMQRAG